MDFLAFLGDHWSTVTETVTAFSVLFAIVEFRRRTAEERRRNESRITDRYVKIWSFIISEPSLRRIEAANVDLSKEPVTLEEKVFVRCLLAHLNDVYRASKKGLFIAHKNLMIDVRSAFTLPILASVWKEVRAYQDADFADFVEQSIEGAAE